MNQIRAIFWNRDEGRLRAGWRLLVFAIAWLAVLAAVLTSGDRLLRNVDDAYAADLASIVHVVLVGTLLLGVLGARLLDRRRVVDYGLRVGRGWWLDLVVGAAIATLVLLAIFMVELGMGWISVTGTFATKPAGLPFVAAVPVAVVGVLAGAAQEELTWRGYFTTNAIEGLRSRVLGTRAATILAIVILSALFGLMHSANPGATTLTPFNTVLVAALVLSTAYVLTGQLGMSIGFHAAWNWVQVGGLGFYGGATTLGASFVSISEHGPALWTGGSYGPEGGLLGTGGFLLAFLLVLGWVRIRNGSRRLHPSLGVPPTRVAVDRQEPIGAARRGSMAAAER
jgi:uncharacterized protein